MPTARIGAGRRNSFAARFAAEQDVRWFEEPVSSDDLAGLRRLRATRARAMEIAAGEYGYTLDYFRRMLEAGAVDVQQADATRCGGVTGFLQAATLCEAYHTDLSAHCAPALHLSSGLRRAALPPHRMVPRPRAHRAACCSTARRLPNAGAIAPDCARPGLGLALEATGRRAFRGQCRSGQ